MKETVVYALWYCKYVCVFLDIIDEVTVSINPKQLVLFNVGYHVDNIIRGQVKNVWCFLWS